MWEFSSVFWEQTVLHNYLKQLLSCAHVKIRLKIVLEEKIISMALTEKEALCCNTNQGFGDSQ